jgi:MORN repeat variant
MGPVGARQSEKSHGTNMSLRAMPKLNIKRFYYRSGRIHTEIRSEDGKLHGLHRTWHRNGQLVEELRYRHGLLHGSSRQWAENGNLLGSFAMVHGTGLQRYWYNNGRLRTEINSLEGKFHGRVRSWLSDGTLVQENFLIRNRDVARAAYLKAARENPDWPQYANEPAGRVPCGRAAIERREFELFILSILENPGHAEARAWLNGEPRPGSRSLAKFATAKAAFKFVEQLYAAGAESVITAAIYGGKRGKLFADWLLVQLPRSKSKRAALRKICQKFCDRRRGAVLPEKDIRETHLYLMLA